MEVENQRAMGTAQALQQDALEAVHQARPGDAVKKVLAGPNVKLSVALAGLDAAMQTAKNLGVTPEEREKRRQREKERREKDDLKTERDVELFKRELRRERQVTENIIGAALTREAGGEMV